MLISISIGAKSHHVALTDVIRRFVFNLPVHFPVALHALLDLIARASNTLILIIASVPHLRVLRCLEGMYYSTCAEVKARLLVAKIRVMRLLRDAESIRQLYIRIRINECTQRRVRPIDIFFVARTMQ